jgi:hypothetical protein
VFIKQHTAYGNPAAAVLLCAQQTNLFTIIISFMLINVNKPLTFPAQKLSDRLSKVSYTELCTLPITIPIFGRLLDFMVKSYQLEPYCFYIFQRDA